MAQEPAGIRWLHVHPMHLIDEEDRMIVAMAAQHRDHGALPEPGGYLDQPAATMAAIDIVKGAWAQLSDARRAKAERE